MGNDWFVIRHGLMGAARFPSLGRSGRISAAEFVLLLTCGAAAAAAVAYVKVPLIVFLANMSIGRWHDARLPMRGEGGSSILSSIM